MAPRPVGARRFECAAQWLAPAQCPRRGASRFSAWPVPDQRERAAVLVLDEVREDRRREGGVVEPDLVVFATALLGRLGPGRAELDRAGVEAVGGSAFLLALDGLQRDLGAEVEGLDLALERAVAVEGECADVGHDVISFCLSEPPRAALMAINRPGAIDPHPKGRSTAESGGRRRLVARGMARSGRRK